MLGFLKIFTQFFGDYILWWIYLWNIVFWEIWMFKLGPEWGEEVENNCLMKIVKTSWWHVWCFGVIDEFWWKCVWNRWTGVCSFWCLLKNDVLMLGSVGRSLWIGAWRLLAIIYTYIYIHTYYITINYRHHMKWHGMTIRCKESQRCYCWTAPPAALTSSVVDPETERPTETAEPNVPTASEGGANTSTILKPQFAMISIPKCDLKWCWLKLIDANDVCAVDEVDVEM